MSTRLRTTTGNPEWDQAFEYWGNYFGVDPNLLMAQAYQESRLNPYAVSPKGARGLAQFMPATARQYKLYDPFNPLDSIRAQANYMRDLLRATGGRTELALAAYNAGLENVRKFGGIPPFRETRNYVSRIMNAYRKISGESDEKKNISDSSSVQANFPGLPPGLPTVREPWYDRWRKILQGIQPDEPRRRQIAIFLIFAIFVIILSGD